MHAQVTAIVFPRTSASAMTIFSELIAPCESVPWTPPSLMYLVEI
jgi:hypothetical protein